ncbi:MAG: hypothetical protein H8E45_07125 [Proteobacteria bacterium]|nr:hypothetical protein [Pseudomonadota bacterium]
MAGITHAGRRPAVEVTECGTLLRGDGFLSADLDCSGRDVQWPANVAVRMKKRGSTLDLDGFEIVNDGGHAVFCSRACRINGPGTLRSTASGHAAAYTDKGHLRVSDVVVEGPWWAGFAGGKGKITAVSILVTGTAALGIEGTRVVLHSDELGIGGGDGAQAEVGRVERAW